MLSRLLRRPLSHASRVRHCAKAAADAKAAAVDEAITELENLTAIARLDMRVGRIEKAWRHPEADRLYCEMIDVGEDAPRSIVSGLVAHYPEAEDLVGRQVIVVCNMKKSKLKGVVSQGMVLCAEADGGASVELLSPPAASQPGDRVVAQGVVPAPVKALKTAMLEKVFGCGKLHTGPDGVATFRGVPLLVGDAAVSAPTLRLANIR